MTNSSLAAVGPVLLALIAAACATATPPQRTDAEFEAIAPRLAAIVVMRGERVIEERYFGETTVGTLLNTRSVTKTVTAMSVGAAIGDGAIAGVGADARPLIWGSTDSAARAPIRFEDLLTMSSALNCNDNDAESPGNEENMYPLQDWQGWARSIPEDPTYSRDADGHGPFRYCTGGVVLLGAAIESATNQSLDRFTDRRVLEPLGIEHLTWTRSPTGQVMPGGGLELRARDLAKLGALLAQGGHWEGRQILPADFVDAMLSRQRTANAEQEYGYLIWRRTYRLACGDFTLPYMAGNGGNAVVILPDQDAAAVVARTAYNTRGMHQQTTALLEQVVLPEMLCRSQEPSLRN